MLTPRGAGTSISVGSGCENESCIVLDPRRARDAASDLTCYRAIDKHRVRGTGAKPRAACQQYSTFDGSNKTSR